jgi:hypothetical protein
MIQDPGRPIGTYVFTATGNIDGTADLRWTVVSLKGRHGDSPVAAARDVPDAEPPPHSLMVAVDVGPCTKGY